MNMMRRLIDLISFFSFIYFHHSHAFQLAPTLKPSRLNSFTLPRLELSTTSKQDVTEVNANTNQNPPSISGKESVQHTCQFCSEKFDSRNALFRHLRNSVECASKANGGKEFSPYCLRRNDVILSISYDCFESESVVNGSGSNTVLEGDYSNDARAIGNVIKDAFEHSLKKMYDSIISSYSSEDEDLIPYTISSTQTSVANQRHKSLSQENACGAVGEVMTLSYMYPVRKTLADEKKGIREQEKNRVLTELIPLVEKYLRKMNAYELASGSTLSRIEVLAAKNIPSDGKMHAETSCTQRAYHYLLPLRWLDGGEDIEKWWLDNRNEVLQQGEDNATLYGINGEMRAKTKPPNQTLRILKDALRTAECKTLPPEEAESHSSGRYGLLSMKPRRAWHNFAAPSLAGDASPNNKPVWRVLDRCRLAQFVPFEDNAGETKVMAVIEFRGDDFVVEQIRRIVGAAVAITNGWLKPDFMETATRSDLFIETPLAPGNRMYFSDARFHFDELIQGKRLFENVQTIGRNNIDCILSIQKEILERKSTFAAQEREDEWLAELRDVITPRIEKQLKQVDITDVGSASASLKDMPQVYTKSLSLLRGIISSGQWPSTSTARSRVIKKDDNTDDKQESEKEVIESGSFTIINPKFEDGRLMSNPKIRIPKGNELFPDLVEAIFDLELSLSNDTESGVYQRPPSSHCAVNRNAQFTPHVDSGRGAGQSMSMICGLGDYNGGDLMIEGNSADIRYTAVEFDGWKQRHWTAPFNGERYSLVWFTPEM